MFRERGSECGCGRVNTSKHKFAAKLFYRALDAHPRGVLGETEFGADFGERKAIEEAQRDGMAVAFGETVKQRVDQGPDFRPGGVAIFRRDCI